MAIFLDSTNIISDITLSNNNLTATWGTDLRGYIKSNKGITKGKWYWEVTINSAELYASTEYIVMIGVINSTVIINDENSVVENYAVYYSYQGGFYKNGEIISQPYGEKYAPNDTIGCALDMDNKEISFYKNGIFQGTISGLLGDELSPLLGNGSHFAQELTINFGDNPFKYAIPNGYRSYREVEIYYLIQNGTDIYSINPNLFKIGSDPITQEIFDEYGSKDLINITKIFDKSIILMDKIGTLENGNEFKAQLNSEILSMDNVEVE